MYTLFFRTKIVFTLKKLKNKWKEFIGKHLLSKKKCDLPNESKLHIIQLHAV